MINARQNKLVEMSDPSPLNNNNKNKTKNNLTTNNEVDNFHNIKTQQFAN